MLLTITCITIISANNFPFYQFKFAFIHFRYALLLVSNQLFCMIFNGYIGFFYHVVVV